MVKTNLKDALALLVWLPLILHMSCSNSDEPQRVNCETSDLAISFTASNPTSCAVADGSITVNATGGGAPYQFAMDAKSYTSGSSFTGLGAGIYVMKVKDKNGCERTTNVTLTSPNSSLAATIQITDSGCKFNNGALILNATGGTPPYSYQLNNGTPSSTNAFFNLASGNYSIRVSDQIGCSVTQTVNVLTGIKYSIDVKKIIDANCNISGCHDGTNVSFKVLANLQASAKDVKSRTQSGNMPKNAPKLLQADLDAIACWVDDGARDN